VLEFAPNAEVVPNADLRKAISATGLPWRVRDNASGIEMLLVPPGAFAMGCSSGASESCFVDEFPVHAVALTGAFYIGRFEVTQGEWTAVTGSNPAYFRAPDYPDGAARPVERVTLAMIGSFLKRTGLRLPTEAEWEHAYRGGSTTPFHSTAIHPDGIDDLARVGDIAWYEVNNGEFLAADWGTKPVGTKAANALGVHDMAGNISEWVSDWYGAYPEEPQIDPTGPETGSDRILRGGDWMSSAHSLRASVRSAIWSDTANLNHGFRVARHP
jgi:formylglycine-generating enzyme required for sulfatase activity